VEGWGGGLAGGVAGHGGRGSSSNRSLTSSSLWVDSTGEGAHGGCGGTG